MADTINQQKDLCVCACVWEYVCHSLVDQHSRKSEVIFHFDQTPLALDNTASKTEQ